MTQPQIGHCKHGEFNLQEGCPQCIAEARAKRLAAEAEAEMTPDEREAAALGKEIPVTATADLPIVKVRYYSETTGEASDREYSYFTIDRLKVGDVVQVPVRDTFTKALVTAIDVPESEIESFRDQVKIIPPGYIIRVTEVLPEEAAAKEGEHLQVRLSLSEGVSEEAKEAAAVLEDITGGQIQVVQPEPAQEGPAEKPPALAVIETQVGKPTNDLFVLYQEAAGLLQVAKKRVITTNEDLKPATNDLAIIATCKKAMFARKDEIVGPFKARLDAMNQAFADLMFPVLEADRLTRGQVTTFDNEQKRKAAEAQRIEDEKFKLAQEEAALSGTGEHTQELGTAPSPPPVPERTRTEMGTLGGRSNWKARVLDFAQLPDEYKLPNEPLLNSFARSTKGERPIPGVEFYDDRVVTMRTKS